MPLFFKGALVSCMLHTIYSVETVDEILMIFVFVANWLALPALAGLLALLSYRVILLLGLRWVATLATLVVCHIRIISKFFLPLFAVAGVMAPLFLLLLALDLRLPPLCHCAELCWCGG